MDWDLRCGSWQEALADVEQVDALIVDAPYSARTHAGHYTNGERTTYDGGGAYDKNGTRRPLVYNHWDRGDVEELVAAWLPRVRGWWCSITDHILAQVWIDVLREAGLYAFHPLPWVEYGKQPRLSGDGPASWSCYVVVARPKSRRFSSWGSLPGAYVTRRKENLDRHIGGKPLHMIEQLVRDYTRPGDLVCDPCAGYGTTLAAAVRNGRRGVGAELDPETHAKALAWLDRNARAVDMWSTHDSAPARAVEQLQLEEVTQ